MTVDEALVCADTVCSLYHPASRSEQSHTAVVLAAEVRRLRECLARVTEAGVYCGLCGSYCTHSGEAEFTGDAEHAEWTCAVCLAEAESE